MRQGVAHLRTVFEISERRACSIVKADRKMVRYRSCRPPETALRERLHALAAERRRFGYRRLFVLLRREGEPSGKNPYWLTPYERWSAVWARAQIATDARARARGEGGSDNGGTD